MNKILIVIAAMLLAGLTALFISYRLNNLHITAVFDELEPFPHNINVYYKGFKLGRSIKVYPSKDFTQTHVEMVLHMDDVSLPDNITAKVKVKNKKDYIELIYPQMPSVTYLKNRSYIKGEKGVNFASFIQDQADSGSLDGLTDNLSETVQTAGETLNALTDLFHTANDILIDLKPALKESGDNLAITTGNLASVSAELNRSTGQDRLGNTFSNIELITRNLELTTSNTALLTKRADNETIALINCLIKNINTVVLNINDIVKGFKQTLSKRFAGMRIMFGKPIS